MITLTLRVSRRAGQPNYGSAGYEAELQTPVNGIDAVPQEASRLYALLEECVDREIAALQAPPAKPTQPALVAHTGRGTHPIANGNGNGQGPSVPPAAPAPNDGEHPWTCSDAQKQLLLRVLAERGIDRPDAEDLAQRLFSASIPTLSKMAMSGLLSHLLEGKQKGVGSQQGRKKGAAR